MQLYADLAEILSAAISQLVRFILHSLNAIFCEVVQFMKHSGVAQNHSLLLGGFDAEMVRGQRPNRISVSDLECGIMNFISDKRDVD